MVLSPDRCAAGHCIGAALRLPQARELVKEELLALDSACFQMVLYLETFVNKRKQLMFF
jgi:hypothetical protein